MGNCWRKPGVDYLNFTGLFDEKPREGTDFEVLCKSCYPGGEMSDSNASSSGSSSNSDHEEDKEEEVAADPN